MRLCSICEREITKHNRFTESKTYKNHSTFGIYSIEDSLLEIQELKKQLEKKC